MFHIELDLQLGMCSTIYNMMSMKRFNMSPRNFKLENCG